MSPPLRWNLDPWLIAALCSYLVIYVVRWRRARAEAGPRGASGWRLASFATGVLALFVGLCSPIAGLGEQLFSFHMLQHILIADLAAIFMILGCTKVILRPVTGRLLALERRLGWLMAPAVAVVIYAGTLWVWHLPAMYQLGLENPTLHPLQHLSFSAAAFLFWWTALSPIRPRRRMVGMGVVLYIAAAKVLTGVLASVITWAPTFLYEYYAEQPAWLGLGAKTDQSVAGALMMAEESIILTIAMALLFIRMLAESDREADRLERYGPGGGDTQR